MKVLNSPQEYTDNFCSYEIITFWPKYAAKRQKKTPLSSLSSAI